MSALHTGYESTITGDSDTMTGELLTTDCDYNSPTDASNPTGCGVYDVRTDTYGTGFNTNGRIVAMEWTDDAIKVWSWSRGSEPSDIQSGSPLPGSSAWGLPAQVFSGADANIPANFKNHKIMVDTTFCGDFAEAVWASEGCAASTQYDTCAAFVAGNPTAFVNAYWEINSIKVYQKTNQASSSTTSTTQSSTSSSSAISTSLTTTLSTSTISTSTSRYFGNGTTTSVGSSTSGSTTIRSSGSTSGRVTSSASSSSTSGSSWADWIEPKDQKTGNANPVVTGFPMGAGVSGAWSNWRTSEAVTYVTTTMTTTYVVPCSTGLETKTAAVTTSFVGGKKNTYTPSIPMSTYTTSCPAEWGFGGPVTVTAPATKTVSVYTSSATNGSKNSSGQSNSSNGDKNGGSSSTGANSSENNKSNNNYNNQSSNSANGSNNSSNGSQSSKDVNNSNGSSNSNSNANDGWGNGNNLNSASTKTSIASVVRTPAATASSNWSVWNGAAANTNVQSSTQASSTSASVADWSAWTNGNGYNVNSASTMTTISTAVATPVATASNNWSVWNDAAASTPVQSSAQASSTNWSVWNGAAASTPVQSSAQASSTNWSVWNGAAASTTIQSSVQAAGTGAATANWSAWNNGNSNSDSDVSSPIAQYTGAASSRTSISLIAGFFAMGAALLL